MREARACEDFVILPDGTIAIGATVVRRHDSIVMEDGSDIPQFLLESVKLIPKAGAAPGRRRVRLRIEGAPLRESEGELPRGDAKRSKRAG